MSAVTSTELGYLDGVTSNVQSQLNGKQAKLTNPLTQSDIINNLSSTAANKPLSAAQGKVLAEAITSLSTYTFDGTNTVSVPSAWNALGTKMGDVVLKPGVYLVLIYATWGAAYNTSPTAGQNARQIEFGTASANNYYATGASAGSVPMGQELFALMHVSTETTYYFRAKQYSGASLSCTMSASHVKLK